MTKLFNHKEIDILQYVAKEVCEQFVELRKGLPQTSYIMYIPEDSTYFCCETYTEQAVPKHLVGYWMMEYPEDLRYKCLRECIKDYPWIKCKEQEVITTEWVRL